MEEGQPSFTAIASAMHRAAHLLWDDAPKIFEDTFALRLSGYETETALGAQLDRLAAEVARSTSPQFALTLSRSIRAMIIMRARYLEDEVERAVGRGVSQYVILGAGLDSFAYRRTDLASVLRVFEVDHPATQAWKRRRLREEAIDLPPNLTLVPVDFETQSLLESLRVNGYRINVPAVFSWLGVTMYLPSDAIFSTLRTVAALAPGTEIIFQYSIPKELVDQETRRMLEAVMAVNASRGEPFKSCFEPVQLMKQVRSLGFAEVSNLNPDEAETLYFSGRTDGLRPPASEHYMRARVGSRAI
jgi:methyltransferase (TIGR00027 family)